MTLIRGVYLMYVIMNNTVTKSRWTGLTWTTNNVNSFWLYTQCSDDLILKQINICQSNTPFYHTRQRHCISLWTKNYSAKYQQAYVYTSWCLEKSMWQIYLHCLSQNVLLMADKLITFLIFGWIDKFVTRIKE